MFYIDKYKQLKRHDFTIIHMAPTIIVFVAFIVITLLSWQAAKTTVLSENDQLLQQHMTDTKTAIEKRLGAYQDVLRACSSFFDASNEVTRNDWKQFIATFGVTKRYPGIQGIGFAQVIPQEQLQNHTDSIRAQGFPDYTVYPSGQRNPYTSIVYIEPFLGRNVRAFGYDMYSEPIRKKAMDRARDSGEPAITTATSLVQEDPNKPQPGFLMYLPLYQQGTNTKSTAEKRSAIIGYVYAPFRASNLFSEIIKDTGNFGVQIYDRTSQDNETVLYRSPNFKTVQQREDNLKATTQFAIGGETWLLSGVMSQQATTPRQDMYSPATILWGGLIFSLCTAGLIYFFLLSRTNRLLHKEDIEIQQAKDELLALASHQLRTPATGVKQYMGMLREGYGGTLNPEQRKLLDKAFQSNERQLATINDILVTARVDTGKLDMNYERINMVTLVNDILDEQEGAIKERHQSLQRIIPKKSIYAFGDRRYLRMALENIVSNATKYTPSKGNITVSLCRQKTEVCITVRDTGVGVDRQDYPLLFRKFSRIPNELTNQVSGTGIGLYLTKKIVDLHNGTIDFESDVHNGSSFTMRIPAASNLK